MAVNTRPSFINDGGSRKPKKEAQNSFDAMVEAEQALKQWQQSQSGKGGSASPSWNTLNEARQQAASNAVVRGAQEVKRIVLPTYQSLKSTPTARQLNQAKEKQRFNLDNVQKMGENSNRYAQKLYQAEKKLTSMKSVADEYQRRAQEIERFRNAYELTPSQDNQQAYLASVDDYNTWINENQSKLDEYDRAVDDYNQAVNSYNMAQRVFQNAVDSAYEADSTYKTALNEYQNDGDGELSQEVRKDYDKLENRAMKSTLEAYESQVEKAKQRVEDLEKEQNTLWSFYDQNSRGSNGRSNNMLVAGAQATREAAGQAALQRYNQIRDNNMQAARQELQEAESALSQLTDRNEALQMERQAKSDPNFQKYVEKGKAMLEENRSTTLRGSGDASWFQEYEAMTEDQKNTYAYYLGKTGKEQDSINYKDKIQWDINSNMAQEYQQRMEEYSAEHPVRAGIASVFVAPAAAAQTTADMLAAATQPENYNAAADPNTRGQRMTRGVSAMREAGLENIDNDVLRALAEAGYSIADMVPSLALSAAGAPGVGLAYMGALSGTGNYTDAASRGATQGQALAYGAGSGALSAALEKIPLENLTSIFTAGKTGGVQILKNILAQAGTEGTEEFLEQVATTAYDELLMGEKSQVGQLKRQYMEQGVDEAEAARRARRELYGNESLKAAALGALSGGIMAAGGSAVSNAFSRDSRSQQLRDMGLSQEEAENLINAQRPKREYSIQELTNDERVDVTEIKEVPNSMTEDVARVAPSTPASVGDFYTPSVVSDSQNVNAESRAAIEKLSSDMGIATVFDDTLAPNENGYYDTQTGEIHLNPNADVNTVFSHELTHSLENTQAYQKLKDLVLNQLGDQAETLRQQKTELYQNQGKNLDVDAELVADYVSQNLFTDAYSIRRLAQQDRGLATRIKNWITRMVAKVTGKNEKAFLSRAEDLYSQALQESVQGREGVSLKSSRQAGVTAQEEGAAAGSEARSYSMSSEQQTERLQRENQELRRQMTRTTENKVNPTRLKSTARQILRGYDSQYSSSSLESDLNELYTLMGNEEVNRNGKTVERTYDTVKAEAMEISKKILEESEVLNESPEYRNIVDILKSNSLFIPEDIRSDIEGGYANFRRAHRGEINFKQDGQTIEELWQTLEAEYPGLFTEEYINPGDMVNRLGEVLTQLKPSRANPFMNGQADFATEQELLANDIMERFYSIPQRAPTFADRRAAKLVREKIRSRKQLDAEKARGQARVKKVQEESRAKRIELKKASSEKVKQVRAEERDKRQQQVKELKVHQKEMDAAARDRRNRRETRQKITRHVKELSQKVLHPTDKKHIPDELTTPVASLLEAVNLESNFSTAFDAEGKLRRAAPDTGSPTKRTEAFRELKEAYGRIAKDPRWNARMVIDPDLEANIDAVIAMKDVRLMDMTQEQLNTVWNTIRAVEHSISTVNQLFADERYKSVAELGDSVQKGLNQQAEKVERRGPAGKVGRLLNVDMLNPWDYFHQWGNGGEAMYQSFRAAQDQQIRDIRQMQDFMADFDSKEIREWMDGESQEFNLNDGRIRLTTAQKMSLYLLMKRSQAKRHILVGGIKQGETQGKRGKIEKSSRPIRVTENEIKTILDSLTPEQKRVADRIGRFMSTTMSEWGNETSMKLYGYQKFTEENYFPIRSDTNYTNRELAQEGGQGSIRNKGFTKALTENAANPVIVNDIFSEFARHGAEMAAYHSYLPALEDAERVYNYRPYKAGFQGSVSEALERAFGKDGKDYFTNFIQDINGRANLRNDFDVGALLSNYKRAAVGANLRVIIQQPTSYLRAAAVINPKYLIKAVFTPKKWATVLRYSPIAQWKDWGYFEINTGRQLEDVILGTDTRFEKIQQGLMAGAGKADEITWTRLWSACEYWVKDHRKNLVPDTPEFYQAVNEKFNEVVDRTQVVDSVLHRSQIMRSTTGLNKMATSFMGEPTKSYNLVRTAVRDYIKAPKSEKGRAGKRMVGTMAAFAISGTVNAAAAALVDALRDDDKDEVYLEKWAQAFTGLQGDEENAGDILASLLSGNLGDNLNLLNMIPYVKDVLSLVQGYTLERMDMSSIADFITTGKRLINSLEGEGSSSVLKNSADLLLQFAKIAGVPAANLARDIGGVTQTIIGSINDPVINYYYDQISAPLKKNKGMYYDILYSALEQGNMDAYETIRDDMLENGITLGDIREAMRARFKAAWEEDPSLENNAALMLEAGVSKDTIQDWKLNDFKNQWMQDPTIADDKEAMQKAGVTEDNIQAWQEQIWKESGYVKDLNALGVDTSTIEHLMNSINNASSSTAKREVIRNSNLENRAKAVLYRYIASEKDREILDTAQENGLDVGEVYRLLDGIADSSKTQDKLNVLANSTLDDASLQWMLEEKIFQEGSSRPETLNKMIQAGLTVKDFIGVYNEWSNLDSSDLKATEAQTEFSKWLDQQGFDEQQQIIIKDGFGFYSQIRAGETKYDRFGNAGLSADVAASMEEMLSELTPEEGANSVSSTQQALAISQGDYTDEDKLKALSVVMQDESYEDVQKAYEEGISPSTYVQYWSDIKGISADKDENGKSISGSKKQKVMTYIDSLDLTTEQKDYLYRENGWAESSLGEAPWYGGPSYDGPLFNEESSGVDGENVWAAASEVVEDQSSKITQRYGVNGHGGTDIGWSISPTEPIYAAGSGTVTWVETGHGNAPGSSGNASYGNLVEIQHEDGTYTLYAHLSNVEVKEGDTVSGGQQIGNMGNTGNSYGNHLHFEYRDANHERLDSTAFILGEAQPSSGGTDSGSNSGSSSSSGSSGSSSRGRGSSSGSGSKKLSPVTLSTTTTRRTAATSAAGARTIPKASAMNTSKAISLSLPTVKKVTKSAISGTKGIDLPKVGGVESRVSRDSSDVRFIKL